MDRLIVLLILPFALLIAPPRQENIEGLVRRGNIIFKGTVQRLNAATMPIITVTDRTVVVKVNEVLISPQVLGDFTGGELTVQLREPGSVRVGLQSVLFTQGWLLGTSIAVLEVGRIDNAGDTTNLRKQIAEALQKIADEELKQHLATAGLVVVGKVSEIREPTSQIQRQPISEHEPQLREAVLQVESVEKGQLSEKRVIFLFANSMDVLWFQAPKFNVGQDGIFILHRNQVPGLQVAGFTALDPSDYQLRDQLDRIRKLVKDP